MNANRIHKLTVAAISLVLAASLPAGADPTWYVAPNTYPGSSSTLDVPWQTAVGSFVELNLDGYANGFDVDTLLMGTVTVDVGLGGTNGTASTAEIYAGSWGGAVLGTVYNKALLNRDASNLAHSEITFGFSSPVSGFGAWLFDNNKDSQESFVMTVTELGGATFTSGVLESGNGTAHFVEGWLGATSAVGITGVSYRVITTTGLPAAGKFFELDHLQIGPVVTHVPLPGAVLLGFLGLGAAGMKLRRLV